jgi:hypothetical protein
MPACDVLTESVARAVTEFQARGGIVVADETVTPRILPDILLERRARSGRPDEDKAALQALAARLRAELDPYVRRHAESHDPDVVLRVRRRGAADYVFAVNDRRTFGDYVGHHGKVMERGLPAAARVTVRRPAAAVYDLVAGAAVPAAYSDSTVAFDVELGPGGGGVYLVSPQAVDAVLVSAPDVAARGDLVDVEVQVVDADGNPVDAVVPVALELLDPEGRAAEGSGAWAAVGGRLTVPLDLASNDVPGLWTLRASEGASGQLVEAHLRVRP